MTPRRKWAEIVKERDDYIVARYRDGASQSDIADEVGVNISLINTVCIARLGRSYKHLQKRVAVRAACEQGMMVKEIAEVIGCHFATVRYVLKSLGLKAKRGATGLRGGADWPRHEAHMKERLCEMVAMREAGKTLQQIGDTYGLTRETVRLYVGHIDVGTEERICPVCDEPFEIKKTSIVVYCSTSCLTRVRRRGVDQAREMAVAHRERQLHVAAGEWWCGVCRLWLPTKEFTSRTNRCRQCAREHRRKLRGSGAGYGEAHRQSCAEAQQARRDRERQQREASK